MHGALTCHVHPAVDPVSPEEWTRLFPDLPDALEMVRCVQDCGIPGFTFHSIVVRQDQRPILLLPLFETTYRLSTLVDASTARVAETLMACVPRLGRLRLLGVGFVEGEWGQVGVDAAVDRTTLEAAWNLALQALRALAQGLRADLTAFVHFTEHSGRMLPMGQLAGFCQIPGLPFAQTRIVYDSTEAYIAGLSANMRSSLRRKLRKAEGVVEVLRTNQPGPWLDAIYQLYLETYRRSDVTFSAHPREFFKTVCQRVADAEYALYFVGERLAAFRLQVVRPDRLIDKYFGMDATVGREHNLYFVSWVKDIEHCIARRIALYHSGLTEEETKARLGARFLPSRILFKHHHPVCHWLLTRLARRLAYRPTVPTPPMRLGLDWEAATAPGPVEQGALVASGERA